MQFRLRDATWNDDFALLVSHDLSKKSLVFGQIMLSLFLQKPSALLAKGVDRDDFGLTLARGQLLRRRGLRYTA